MKLRVLDLFSGIGGFSLGLERTGGFETVAFCEIEEFPRKVLAKHWPNVPIYDDVRMLNAERLAADGIGVDVITGGFPCQDISIAGKKAGMGDGTRSGLWSEVVRLACELRPRFIILENVANLLAGPSGRPGAWFGRVLADLAECGFDAEWENIPAAALGACHRRERVWIVAYPSRQPVEGGSKEAVSLLASLQGVFHSGVVTPFVDRSSIPGTGLARSHNGIPNQVERIKALGNAVVPQIPEMIGHAILKSMREAA
jgi:DNA (cytosine-5)-methyltransferase 1